MGNRVIDTNLWQDQKWRSIKDLKIRYLWLYLLSCPNSFQIGIFYLPFDEMCLHTRLTEEEVKKYLTTLEELKLCKYSYETEEILIYNYVKYNINAWGKPVVDMLTKQVERVKNKSLLFDLFEYLNHNEPTDKISRVIEFLKPLRGLGIKETNTNTNTITYTITDTCHDTLKDNEKTYEELLDEIDNARLNNGN